MAFRKYQSVQKFDALSGEKRDLAAKTSSIKRSLDEDALTDDQRRALGDEYLRTSAKLAE